MAVTPEERNEAPVPAGGDQLAWEARLGPRIGVVAIAGALLVLASFVVQLPLLKDKSKNEAGYLLSVHKHASAYITSGILQMLAFFAVAALLWYLYRATKYRRPQTPPVGVILGIAGPIVFGIASAVGPFVIRHFAAEFANGLNHTNQHAKDIVKGGSAEALNIITPIAGLSLVFGMVMTNVNAIRTGLLSTFAGIIGVIAGVLYLLPLGPPQLLLFFWFVSVAIILHDRWPGGRGPAWAAGEAIKWPTAADRRGLTAGSSNGARAGTPPPPPADIDGDEMPAQRAGRTSRKRKRKQGRKH
ncbi:MAG TPA: DUF4386 family protein [Thermoleophilaceae bacterium]|nr:DUF4386 family protein [Thermoleophilaceae bacterium]